MAGAICTRCLHSNQTSKAKPEPDLHQPGHAHSHRNETRAKPKIKAKWHKATRRDFPVPLDLPPGKVGVAAFFDSFKQFHVGFLQRSYSIISILEASECSQSKHSQAF